MMVSQYTPAKILSPHPGTKNPAVLIFPAVRHITIGSDLHAVCFILYCSVFQLEFRRT